MHTLIHAIGARLGKAITLDLRSLAAFRMAAGLILLADLGERLRSLTAHYTDSGLLARSELALLPDAHYSLSIHCLTGSAWGEGLLFLLAAGFAAALLVGYRTRLATIASWYLLVSLHGRNPLVLDHGDAYLRMLLFWGMFLPLGNRFSVDAWRVKGRDLDDKPQIATLASCCFLLQIVLLYTTTGFFKSGPTWTQDGSAIYYALMMDFFTTPFGIWLRQFPDLLQVLTPAVLILERFGSLLLISPVVSQALRLAAVLAFAGLHVGIGLTMELAFFPPICCAALLAVLPSSVWDFAGKTPIARRLRQRFAEPPSPVNGRFAGRTLAGVARGLGCLKAWLKAVPMAVTGGTAGLLGNGSRALMSALRVGVLAAALALVVAWNIASIAPRVLTLPPALERIGYALRLEQSWRMFAPEPFHEAGWYVFPGETRDGRAVDAWRHVFGAPSSAKPPVVSAVLPDGRWRELMLNIAQKVYAAARPGFGRYICGVWRDGADHSGADLVAFDFNYMYQKTGPGETFTEPRAIHLLHAACDQVGH